MFDKHSFLERDGLLSSRTDNSNNEFKLEKKMLNKMVAKTHTFEMIEKSPKV